MLSTTSISSVDPAGKAVEYSPLLSTFRVYVSLFLSVITIAASTFEMSGPSKSWAPCVLASF
jgi:hypothetical protein